MFIKVHLDGHANPSFIPVKKIDGIKSINGVAEVGMDGCWFKTTDTIEYIENQLLDMNLVSSEIQEIS
jgi:hypothetical protein